LTRLTPVALPRATSLGASVKLSNFPYQFASRDCISLFVSLVDVIPLKDHSPRAAYWAASTVSFKPIALVTATKVDNRGLP
jgi:hypothetical protein